METITRDELRQMMEQNGDLTLVEVLGPQYYKKYHLPGASNVPVGDEHFEEAIQKAAPDKSKPIVVYCQNEECPASAKAARRLDAMGYQKVYDYEAGKEDWKEAGFETES